MTITMIRAIGQFRANLIDGTETDIADIAPRLGEMAIDPNKRRVLAKITDGRELAGAGLWQRVADHLTGQAEAEILVFAAACSFNAADHDTTAAIITRHRACLEGGALAGSNVIDLLADLLGANTKTSQ